MSAYDTDKKTLEYHLGESLSANDRPLPPDDGDAAQRSPDNFRLFLEHLDRDVYGDGKSLEEEKRRHEAPFYLRRGDHNRGLCAFVLLKQSVSFEQKRFAQRS
jgi:hypothetical protein